VQGLSTSDPIVIASPEEAVPVGAVVAVAGGGAIVEVGAGGGMVG
jgi:hypothetical protein